MATQEDRRRTRLTPTQKRAARRERRNRRRKLLRVGAFSAVGIIAFFFIIALFLPGLNLSFGSTGRTAPTGPGERIASQGGDHIGPDQNHPPYNSVPATSGWHYEEPLSPARWGVHTEALEDEVLVHNLEHGGIGVHYDCPDGCDDLVDRLVEIVRRSDKVILSPYPSMDTKIALTAWTFLDTLDEFDLQRIEDFIVAHSSSPNAPEPDVR